MSVLRACAHCYAGLGHNDVEFPKGDASRGVACFQFNDLTLFQFKDLAFFQLTTLRVKN